MAVFKTQRNHNINPGFVEVEGKIFVDSMAYTATSLAPIMNEQWPAVLGVNWGNVNNSLYMTAKKCRNWNYWGVNADAQLISNMFDGSLLDGGAGVAGGQVSESAYVSGLVTIGNSRNWLGVGNLANPRFSKTTLTYLGNSGDLMDRGPTDSTGFVQFPYEHSSGVAYIITHRQGLATNSTDARRVRLSSYNPNSGAVATILNPYDGSGVGGGHINVIWFGPSDIWLFRSTSATSTANTTIVSTLSKSGATNTDRTTSVRPTTEGTGISWPSYAVATTGNTKAFYRAVYANATGNKWNFQAGTFDETSPSSGVTYTTVTPGNATSIPGSASTNNTQYNIRTWAFKVGTDIYICVATFDVSQNGNLTADNYYIDVYKATTAAPTTINWVSSTQIGTRPHAVIVASDDFSTLVAPYPVAGGVDFFTWNQGTESYVKGAQLAISPRGITVDQAGRIWICEANASGGSNYHVVSPTLAATVAVAFENTNLTYAGSTINTNLIVNAYNTAGSRIANNIALTIDSSVCTFSDDTVSKTVTTSASANTSVGIKVKGAGYIRIFANLAV